MTNELQQSKTHFKFIGKVTGIDKDYTFREDQAQKGAKKGETYRALRFGVKTSETNTMNVEMFDFEPEKVFMWNSEKRKEDKNYKGDRIDFAEWEERQEELREAGYAVLQTRIGLNYGEDGKLISKGLPSFVASKLLYDNLSNGDSVIVEGEIRYNEYEDAQGKLQKKKIYTIQKLFRIKDIDFESEKFEEVTYFEQEMVFVDAFLDSKEGKAFVTGRVIAYGGKWHDVELEVPFKDEEGNVDAGMKKLADAFNKKFKFGDKFNAFGNALNRVIVEEVEGEENEEEDMMALLGGKSKPKHAETYVSRTYISALQIEGVDAWDKKFYTQEDFDEAQKKNELLKKDKKEDLSDELGGKKKKDNPFDTGDDEVNLDDISDDDLPF
ncbi:single-stranded DNA binding protein [Bacillus phage vB_BanS-Thrax1]|nr:single-stranded DNA binding protein [Bacillus phage vB_BanS-Thrax1]